MASKAMELAAQTLAKNSTISELKRSGTADQLREAYRKQLGPNVTAVDEQLLKDLDQEALDERLSLLQRQDQETKRLQAKIPEVIKTDFAKDQIPVAELQTAMRDALLTRARQQQDQLAQVLSTPRGVSPGGLRAQQIAQVNAAAGIQGQAAERNAATQMAMLQAAMQERARRQGGRFAENQAAIQRAAGIESQLQQASLQRRVLEAARRAGDASAAEKALKFLGSTIESVGGAAGGVFG